jgi:hypothetical protein
VLIQPAMQCAEVVSFALSLCESEERQLTGVVSASVEGLKLRCEPHRHRPAATARRGLNKRHLLGVVCVVCRAAGGGWHRAWCQGSRE